MEKVKNQIVDSTLLAGVCAGTVAFLIAYYPYNIREVSLLFFSDLILLASLILICTFRKQIKIKHKAIVVILILLVLVFSDMYMWGLYSLNKVMIVIIPFYTLFIFNFWNALVVYGISLIAFLSIGFFKIFKTQEVHSIIERMNSFGVWIEGAILLSTVALIILIFTRNYNGELYNLIGSLEKKNNELEGNQIELKTKNEKLKSALKEVQFNNDKLTEYTFINSHVLRAPLARMLGLAQVVSKDVKAEKHQKLVHELLASAEELDEVVSKINDSLEEQQGSK
ncbi:MAG: hypothetical protein R8N23_01710 [Reichenbachiella sp.]|uniref:hypothetical protein n=1 Tax=Reichenbachiella sp. TaxID=2184521 RepID=UPI0029675D4D|nr:hypothetical protein [Reichenbachiella sp.]MDW3208555.1 hypothetical protein [Reichenbachiella sp.]